MTNKTFEIAMPEPKRPIKTERRVRLEIVSLNANGVIVAYESQTPADYADAKRIIAKSRAVNEYWAGLTYEIRRVRTSIVTISVDKPRPAFMPATVEEFFERTEFTIAFVCESCGHISAQGQFDAYAGKCARCGERIQSPAVIKPFPASAPGITGTGPVSKL